jgi:DNA helicase HerA-like ATPase
MGDELAALDAALDGAALLGLELDPRYRVLAATLEPSADDTPWDLDVADRRVQVLLFPVSTILASLRQTSADGRTVVRRFADEQLLDVVSAFDGAPVSAPLFGRPEPRPGEWGPPWSLEGRSTAPDGRRRTVTFQLRHADLALDLFARFDDVEVKDAAGAPLPLAT